MTLAFDFNDTRAVEFGVGRDTDTERVFRCIPIDRNVQTVLCEMAMKTWQALSRMENEEEGVPRPYDPAEKYSNEEYLVIPLADENAASLRDLYQAINLPPDPDALDDPNETFAYFARFVDGEGRRLTALRRATQFKGVLKSRLLQLTTDALRLVEDRVFKLDFDFDLLIDDRLVHILRPKAFEFAGQLQQVVMQAVPRNIAALRETLDFIAFEQIESYAINHPRAARYLASIRAAEETQNISRQKLVELCARTSVAVVERDGAVHVQGGNVLGFLEVLDRRRYELELIEGQPESYRAPSRHRLSGRNGDQ